NDGSLSPLEDSGQFEALRAAATESYKPLNVFDQALVDELAESMWTRKRLATITNGALSLQIESSWNEVSQQFPNADSLLRTVRAWNDVTTNPGYHHAQRYLKTAATLSLARIRLLDRRASKRQRF
ncbi:MAG: hypothetical protein HY821_12140, partial [Acidobacteria bacterium]|nr:hypothetical protein [Acidobacteriota bacterium]